MGCIERGAEREGVKVIRPLPLKLINMDVFISLFFFNLVLTLLLNDSV